MAWIAVSPVISPEITAKETFFTGTCISTSDSEKTIPLAIVQQQLFRVWSAHCSDI